MSYGLQYFTNFFDTDENKFRLEILQWQFTGTAQSNITLADNAVTINYNQDDDYFQPIIGSTCKMRFYVEVGTGGDNWENENTLWNEADFAWDKEYTFILPDNDREYKIRVLSLNASGESDTGASAQTVLKDTTASFTSTVKSGDLVVNTSTGNYANLDVVDSDTELTLSSGIFSTSSAQNYEIYRPYWVGFIMQDSYTLPIASRPYAVEVVASDLIGTINGYNMDITTERPETFDVIQNCLKNINLQSGDGTTGRGLDFGYKVLCRLNQYSSSTPSGSSNDNPYTQTYLNSVDSLQDENGNYLNCKYVLESLLRMFNCRIFQHESTWTIIDNASLALTSFSDGGGSYSKEFKFYFKDGQADGTVAIASPVLNIDSTENNSTIQPLNNDLIKIIRRPAIRQRVQVRIKDTLKTRFNNAGYENNTTPSGGTPSWGRNPTDWTIADRTIAYAVNSSAVDTSGGQPVVYGITPYAGDFSLLTIGSSNAQTVVASNNTGNVGTTAEPIKLVFANYVNDPDNTGLLAYVLRFRIKITSSGGTSYYWKVNGQEWVTDATQGINSITGSVQEQWRFNEVSINPPPEVGNAQIEFFIPKEDAYNNSNFRIYYDDVVLQSISDLEYYDTQTKIIDGTFKDNSGVLKSFENRFGMLDDSKYSNCLVDSSGNNITAYKSFDESSGATLETLTNFQRLNEFAINNFRYEGTFRKLSDSSGFTKPIDMLTFPKLAFSTLSDDNHQAIDNLEFNVSKNRYKFSTHIPTQSNLTAFGQIASFTDFYKFKPED
tara:strand:- start:454 stop:2784 length:2331 start_codon:yes stop_codon:yes gene_type:complete